MCRIGSRRRFMLKVGGFAATAVMANRTSLAHSSQPQMPPERRSSPLPDELVHEWVWRGHFDLDGVTRMLDVHPTLLNATYDWGNGDYEMAIGGAGHMGRRDIAEFLIKKGARMDLFVVAMLGKLDIVKATLTAYPSLISAKGPHGIPLLQHAKQGGADALLVLEYLQSVGTV